MKQVVAIVLVCCIAFAGCATVFSGTYKNMPMESTPDNAEVWMDGAKIGITPCKIELKKKDEHTIEFRKEGYKTRSYRITNSVGAGWVVLDILTGFIPVIIDAATGSWYTLDQSNVNAILEKQ